MQLLTKIRERYFGEIETDLRYRIRKRTRPTIVEVNGIKLTPQSALISDKVRRQLYRGTYEHNEMELVQRHLTPDDRVLEIGAGLGAVSAFCAALIGSDRVACVEANPNLEPLIRETHRLNDVAPELLIAVVDHDDGEVPFFLESDLIASSTVRRGAAALEVKLPRMSIKALLAKYRPTFLIIDIEGHELHVFDGLDLSGVGKICLELHPHIIGDEACFSILRTLSESGFVIRIDEIRARNFFVERCFD